MAVELKIGIKGGVPVLANDSLINRIVKQESGGNPNAVSPAGARGLMQTMPGTERDPGFGIAPLDPKKDPNAERFRIGKQYIGALLKKYSGNTAHALAAYNWGPGNVDKWLRKGADPNKLPRETRNYVKNIMGGVDQYNATYRTGTTPPTPTVQPLGSFGEAMRATFGSGEALTPSPAPEPSWKMETGPVPLQRVATQGEPSVDLLAYLIAQQKGG